MNIAVVVLDPRVQHVSVSPRYFSLFSQQTTIEIVLFFIIFFLKKKRKNVLAFVFFLSLSVSLARSMHLTCNITHNVISKRFGSGFNSILLTDE